MILTKEVEVIPSGKVAQYYKNKGYTFEYKKPLIVSVEDLPLGSAVKVLVKCDYCGIEVVRKYQDYLKSVNAHGAYACKKCCVIHRQKTFLEKFGCTSPTLVPEIREKQIKTTMERYGVETPLESKEIRARAESTTLKKYGFTNPFKSEEVKKKIRRTMVEKYGVSSPLQSPEIKEKTKQTCMERYGVDNPAKSSEVREKMEITNQERYGVSHPAKSPEIREKMAQSYYSASSQKCSKQQFHIYNLYNADGTAELNYPISYYNVDICFPAERLVIEYDGGGHNLNVITGRITESEFRRREIARDRTLKKEGYHLMRIISADDKLPSDDTLLHMLNHTREYFAAYPEHSWIEFDLDASTVRNAEHKDGSFFNL